MDEDERLEMNVKVFFGWKNIVVSELDKAVEIVATAFGVEMSFFGGSWNLLVSLVMMSQAMLADRRITETAGQLVVDGAIVELHVPANGDEKHHEGHPKRADLHQPIFHAAKIGKILQAKPPN